MSGRLKKGGGGFAFLRDTRWSAPSGGRPWLVLTEREGFDLFRQFCIRNVNVKMLWAHFRL